MADLAGVLKELEQERSRPKFDRPVLFKSQRYRVTVGCKPSIRAVVHFSSLSFRSLSWLSSATIRARSTAPDVIECNTAPETTPTKYISTRIPIRFTISTPFVA